MTTATKIQELEAKITATLEGDPRYDDNGKIVEDWATCGNCGFRWNDALISGITPAPAGRCPVEYEHKDRKELARLKRKQYRDKLLNDATPTPPSTADDDETITRQTALAESIFDELLADDAPPSTETPQAWRMAEARITELEAALRQLRGAALTECEHGADPTMIRAARNRIAVVDAALNSTTKGERVTHDDK